MTSPYMDRLLIPLAVALPRMLDETGAKLPQANRASIDLRSYAGTA
jgi:hypothetical protein